MKIDADKMTVSGRHSELMTRTPYACESRARAVARATGSRSQWSSSGSAGTIVSVGGIGTYAATLRAQVVRYRHGSWATANGVNPPDSTLPVRPVTGVCGT